MWAQHKSRSAGYFYLIEKDDGASVEVVDDVDNINWKVTLRLFIRFQTFPKVIVKTTYRNSIVFVDKFEQWQRLW